MRIVILVADTGHEEHPCLSEKEEKSCEKQRPDDGVEDRIGSVIVTEILIADEIILDEREAECFSESSERIAVIYFRREDGYFFGAIDEVVRVFVEIVEHRARGDAGGENKYERMSPEPSEKIFVGKNQNREKENEDDRSEAERNIGMETEAE